jgi:hypothetical protein
MVSSHKSLQMSGHIVWRNQGKIQRRDSRMALQVGRSSRVCAEGKVSLACWPSSNCEAQLTYPAIVL